MPSPRPTPRWRVAGTSASARGSRSSTRPSAPIWCGSVSRWASDGAPAAAVGEVAADQDVPSLTGAAPRCRGLLTGDADVLLAAVEAYERSPRPLELALTREDAGQHLLSSGAVDAALPLLDRALVAFECLDAARDVARVRARVRTLDVRRGQRGTRRRPSVGWASLTPTERNVVGLVVEGLSNPQIGERLYVSRRTVQTHLVHVFAKLDVSSRAQLAAEAARRPIDH